MSRLQTAIAGLLILGFLGLVAFTASTARCVGGSVSIADVVRLYGCR